jgi:hypothetical protein
VKTKIEDLLKNTRVEVAPETFTLVSVRHEEWLKLLENPELSPRMTAPFMIFRDRYETTLLLDDTDFQTIRHAVREAKIERNFRLLTFEIQLDFTVIGFLAEITRILAAADISIVALSAFSRDHLLVRQEDLAKALIALRDYVDDVC